MSRDILAHCIGLLSLLLTLVGVLGCQPEPEPPSAGIVVESERPALTGTEEGEAEMKIFSEAFEQGQSLPDRYARKYDNLSPPLTWAGLPEGTVELALICDDPDAPVGVWTHWLIWGISPERTELPEGVPTEPMVATLGDLRQGRNDFGASGYDGPQPPSGTHRYFFRLYALGEKLDLAPGADAKQVHAALEGKVLAQAEIMATYAH